MDALVSKQFKLLAREILRCRSARLLDCRELLSHLTSTTKLDANKGRAFSHREALRCKVEVHTLQRLAGIPAMRTDLPVGGLLSTQLLEHIERVTLREARHVVQSLLGIDMGELVALWSSPVANSSQSPLQDPGTVVALAMLARSTPAFFKRNTVVSSFDVLIQSERIAFKNLLTKANEGARASVHDIRLLSADLLQDFELAKELYDRAMQALAQAEGGAAGGGGSGVGGSLSPGSDGSLSPGRGRFSPQHQQQHHQPFLFDGLAFDTEAAAMIAAQQQREAEQEAAAAAAAAASMYQSNASQLSPGRPGPHEASANSPQSPLQLAANAGLLDPALGISYPSLQEQAVSAAAAAHRHPGLPSYQPFSHELSASALRMRQIESMTQKAHLEAAANAAARAAMAADNSAASLSPGSNGSLSPAAHAAIMAAGSLMHGESIAGVGLGGSSALGRDPHSPPQAPVSAAHYGVTSQHLFQSIPPANKQALMLPVSERQMMALALPGERSDTIVTATGETVPAGTGRKLYPSAFPVSGSTYEDEYQQQQQQQQQYEDEANLEDVLGNLEARVSRIMNGISRGAASRVTAQGVEVSPTTVAAAASGGTSPYRTNASGQGQGQGLSPAGQSFAATAASIHAAFNPPSPQQHQYGHHQFSGGQHSHQPLSAASSERYTEDFDADEASSRGGARSRSTAATGSMTAGGGGGAAGNRTAAIAATANRSRGGPGAGGAGGNGDFSYLDGTSVPPPSTAGDASPNRLSRLGTRSKARNNNDRNSSGNRSGMASAGGFSGRYTPAGSAGGDEAAELDDQPPEAVSLASDRLLSRGRQDGGHGGLGGLGGSSSVISSTPIASPFSSSASSRRADTAASVGGLAGGGSIEGSWSPAAPGIGGGYGHSRPDTQDTYAPHYANQRRKQEELAVANAALGSQQSQSQQQLEQQQNQQYQQAGGSPGSLKTMTQEQLQHALSGPDGDAVAKKMIKEAMSAATAANAKTAGESLAHLRLFGPKTDAGEIRRRNDSWDEAMAARRAHPWLLRLAKLCSGLKILRAYRMWKVRRACKAIRLIAAERGLHPADVVTAKMISNHEKIQARPHEYTNEEKAEMALSGSPHAVSMRRQEGERDKRIKATVRLQAFARSIPSMKARVHLRQVNKHRCRRKAKAAMRAELGLDTGMLAPQLEAMLGLIQQAGTVNGRMEKAIAAVISEAAREAETHARVRRTTVMDTALSADWLTLPRPEDPRSALCYINVRSGRRMIEHPNTAPANKAAKAAADEVMQEAEEKANELRRQAEHSKHSIAKQQLDTANALYRLRLLALTMDDEAGGMGLGREEANKASGSPTGGKFPLGIFPLPRGIGNHNIMSLGSPLSATSSFAAGSMIGPHETMNMPPTGLDAGLSSSSLNAFGLDPSTAYSLSSTSVLGSPGGGMTAVERLRMDLRRQTAALMARSQEFMAPIDFDEDNAPTKNALAASKAAEKQARKAAKGK